jgi:hypothetical protein
MFASPLASKESYIPAHRSQGPAVSSSRWMAPRSTKGSRALVKSHLHCATKSTSLFFHFASPYTEASFWLPLQFEKASVLFSQDLLEEALTELESLKEVAPREASLYFLMGKVRRPAHPFLGDSILCELTHCWISKVDISIQRAFEGFSSG